MNFKNINPILLQKWYKVTFNKTFTIRKYRYTQKIIQKKMITYKYKDWKDYSVTYNGLNIATKGPNIQILHNCSVFYVYVPSTNIQLVQS